MNFKIYESPLLFSLETVNLYFFKWDEMEAVGKCLSNKQLDALHGLCLLEIHPTKGAVGGEYKDAYRASGMAYKEFLTKVLKDANK